VSQPRRDFSDLGLADFQELQPCSSSRSIHHFGRRAARLCPLSVDVIEGTLGYRPRWFVSNSRLAIRKLAVAARINVLPKGSSMTEVLKGIYPVTIDRKTDLIVLATRAGFDRLEQDERNILSALGRESLGSTVSARLRFMQFGKRVETAEVLAEISRCYLSPGSLTELFSLAKSSSENIRLFRSLFPIITLGTEHIGRAGKARVGFVTGDLQWHRLFFVDSTSTWLEKSHFLVSERD